MKAIALIVATLQCGLFAWGASIAHEGNVWLGTAVMAANATAILININTITRP